MRLWPRSDGGQRVRHWQIDAPGRRWVQQDAYGNTVHMTSLVEKHHDISVVARALEETLDERGVLIAHESKVPPLAFALPTPLTQSDAAIEALAQRVLGSQQNPAQITQAELTALCDAVFECMRLRRSSWGKVSVKT